MHSSDTGLIHFDDVRVPASNIIGDEGMGFIYQMLQFQVNFIDWLFQSVLKGSPQMTSHGIKKEKKTEYTL